MKEALHQYFRPTKQEFEALWKEASIVFDASVLLNVYGYSDETREQLLDLIRKFEDRVSLPHQFALEYARNRPGTIVKQINHYAAAESDFEKFAVNRLQPKTEHPYLSPKALEALKLIREELSEGRRRMEAMISSDQYADLVLATFKGKLGQAPTVEWLEARYEEAAGRYDKEIPPGFKDQKDKDVPDCYGDYVAWCQIIDMAKSSGKPAIIVIDDVKEDWWQKEGSRTIGPRPELLEEFNRETGNRVWLYSSSSFLNAAKQYGSVSVKDAVIEEVGARLAALKALEQEVTLDKAQFDESVRRARLRRWRYDRAKSGGVDELSTKGVSLEKSEGVENQKGNLDPPKAQSEDDV